MRLFPEEATNSAKDCDTAAGIDSAIASMHLDLESGGTRENKMEEKCEANRRVMCE